MKNIDWRRLALTYLASFAVFLVLFTLARYLGWGSLTGTQGDLAASLRAELGSSLLWAFLVVAVRLARGRA